MNDPANHDEVERETRPYDVFAQHGFIGCADGPPDLSTTYKAVLTESLEAKLRAEGAGHDSRAGR